MLAGYTLLGKPIDVVETSRGCTFDCSFCSIIAMRGRNFHRRGFERVLADIRDAREHGARAIFIVDDNITLDVKRFEALCDAIVEAGLHDIEYVVQAMTSSIADHGDDARAARCAAPASATCSSGIENVLAEDLGFLKADAKNRRHENGRAAGNATLAAIEHLHANDMVVVGGLIVGNPGDTHESIEANLEFARRYVDWPYIQHPTPYPGTPMTKELLERGLILHERLEEYDGTTAVVRSEALTADEIEFLRWRAERWMKLRHFPMALRHNPGFCLPPRAGDDRPHLPRQLALARRPRERAPGLRPLPGDPRARARPALAATGAARGQRRRAAARSSGRRGQRLARLAVGVVLSPRDTSSSTSVSPLRRRVPRPRREAGAVRVARLHELHERAPPSSPPAGAAARRRRCGCSIRSVLWNQKQMSTQWNAPMRPSKSGGCQPNQADEDRRRLLRPWRRRASRRSGGCC